MKVAEFPKAKVAKFGVKTGKMGESIGVITLEVESMDPEQDFAVVVGMHGFTTHVLIQERTNTGGNDR